MLFSFILQTATWAQGITRQKGLGLRAGFWKTEETSQGIFNTPGTSVIIGGVGMGGSLYYFSRLGGKFFLETSIGAVGLKVVHDEALGSTVESSGILPFLLGCRYDLLPQRLGSSFQPYLHTGLGAYWCVNSVVETAPTNNKIAVESDLKTGAFAGGGLNVVITSWFLFNLDFKYHFVNTNVNDAHSGPHFGMGFSVMWGQKREMFRVEDIEVIVEDIYPAYYQFYSTYPLAKVYIKNTAKYPIEINLRATIKGYSERTYQSGFVRIHRGQTKAIPVFALFGSRLLSISRSEAAMIDVDLEAKAGTTLTRSISAQVMIHNRNAWNGEINKLGFFVTPEHEAILAISREASNRVTETNEMREVALARELFNYLASLDIRYHSDPNILFYQDDRVQFATETLELAIGDCDDLVVLYASLLESVGINTAFVDVAKPEEGTAHVYLLFDTGIPAEQSGLISTNEKRFVLRETAPGKNSVWIPVETTLINGGFEEAWQSGALQYLEEGVLGNGLLEGWVKIIDVN